MSEKLFTGLSDLADSDEQMSEIESYCVNCGQNGSTRILLTEIPFFRQVVIMSFDCPHCHNHNNELQPAQQIAERAIRLSVKCCSPQDLSRRVVKTDSAEIQIPEIEFEVKKQNGMVTTIEGILDRAIEGLQQTIQMSNDLESDSRQKIIDFLVKINRLKDGNEKFTFNLIDISGNSYVENFMAPEKDPQMEVIYFNRSQEEDKLLGIFNTMPTIDENEEEEDKDMKNEVLQFPTNCPNCGTPTFTNMKVQSIPHFKEVVIMATNCESCGHKTTEVKSGSGIEDKGTKIELKIKDENDLKREVVISDTCSLSIPELDIQLSGTGSGRYTTVEGIAMIIDEDLKRSNPFIDGDSSKQEVKEKLNKLSKSLSNLMGYTLILDDPCGNSYVEGVLNPVKYERTFEQNEELGLNDIKTENYS